jgi:hypothetical protein
LSYCCECASYDYRFVFFITIFFVALISSKKFPRGFVDYPRGCESLTKLGQNIEDEENLLLLLKTQKAASKSSLLRFPR